MEIGTLEVITGCMFSGKTESLIERSNQYDARLVQAFKPRIDDRYSRIEIVSHAGKSIPCAPVDRATEIYHRAHPQSQLILIDEAQFFDSELVEITHQLVLKNYNVVVAGLDMDWQGQGFGPMPELLVHADVVTKLAAECAICKKPAQRTQRLVANREDILVGGSEQYEPRCRVHHNPRAVKLAAKRTNNYDQYGEANDVL